MIETREGTTARSTSTSLQSPVSHSTSALERVEVCIVFDPNTPSLPFLPSASFFFLPSLPILYQFPLPVFGTHAFSSYIYILDCLSVCRIVSLCVSAFLVVIRISGSFVHCHVVCLCFSPPHTSSPCARKIIYSGILQSIQIQWAGQIYSGSNGIKFHLTDFSGIKCLSSTI